MTRLNRIMTTVNWKYAIGEVVLIVVGILIALAAADWNDRRVLREEELALLEELRTGLLQDLVAVESALEQVLGAERQLMSLQELLANPRPYDSSMDALFGAVYGNRIIFLNTATYETLKSVGLQTVTNDNLRLRIAKLFNHSYTVMQMNNEIDMEINYDAKGDTPEIDREIERLLKILPTDKKKETADDTEDPKETKTTVH